MTNASSGDLVEAFFRTYDAADAEGAAALYGENGWHLEGASGARRDGREAIRAGLERFFAMMPDASWAVRERIEAGASVVVVYTLSGRLAIDIGGRPTKGLAIALPGVFVFELAGGRIAGTRDYWSPAAFEAQLRNAPR